VPDAIFRMADSTFAVEYDRGGEGTRYFIGKSAHYRRGLPGLPLAAVLVVVDRDSRLATLARAIGDVRGRFLFTTIGAVLRRGMLAPIYQRVPDGPAEPLIGTCSLEVSCRENSFIAANCGSSRECKKSGGAYSGQETSGWQKRR